MFTIGFDRLIQEQSERLRGKRVGLLAHPASLCANGDWSPQRLRDWGGAELAALFGPEHGLYGEGGAGDRVDSSRHPRWDIPIYSLYGEHRTPTASMLDGLDVLIVDLQDLAVRCYTFVSTLRRVLLAADLAGLPVIVTDRPVPFPATLDGPMPGQGCESFVCEVAAPFVYGMTPSEAARWIATRESPGLDLQTIPMAGAARDPQRPVGAPPWVPPSTGIRSWETAWCYPITVFTEALPALDCDRRGLLPFQVLGAPWMDGERVARKINAVAPSGVRVTPHEYVSADGVLLRGIRFVVTDATLFRPVATGFLALQALQDLYGQEVLWSAPGTRPEFFDQLCGSPTPRAALIEGVPIAELEAQWQQDRATFKAERNECLLYE